MGIPDFMNMKSRCEMCWNHFATTIVVPLLTFKCNIYLLRKVIYFHNSSFALRYLLM